jgi:cytochrome c biogenesis protein CcmG, thiol:disulfide interchange protein DsbE
MTRLWLWVPLAAFAVLLAVAASGLIRPTKSENPSRMIGRPLPAFALPAAASMRPALGKVDFTGKPRLLNIFASWCVPCIAEVPVLTALTQQGVTVEGIALRDKRADVDTFLARNGNPYRAIGLDVDSSVQLAIGSSGVPETFVIDGNGVIRHQHIGAIGPQDIPEILLKLSEAQ